jgi:putative nucleotidyltransferase with HDIG domain
VLPFWNAEHELRAKKILYRFLEEMGATKAALHLAGTEGSFELATHYGFGRRDSLTTEIRAGHPVWDLLRRHRSGPAYVNDAHENQALQAFLESSGSTRLMVVPLQFAGRLVGFADVRDKARRVPFEPDDVVVARTIGAAFDELIRETGGYRQSMASTSATTAAVAGGKPAPGATLHRAVIEELATLLHAYASLPSLAAAALTVTDGRSVRCLLMRAALLTDLQRHALVTHQTQVFAEAGIVPPPATSWGWDERDSEGHEMRSDEIHSALVHSGPPVWIVVTLLTAPRSTAAEPVLTAMVRHCELAQTLRNYRKATRNLAKLLLEPGEATFPHLRTHSQGVSELAQRIAVALRLSEAEEELVTVAAYLHDVGMRELDYARIYRLERPGEVERRLFQRHPVLGARIVEAGEFPGDLAGAIRHHHERWDGNGYPHRFAGRNIPLASRIIHIAEVYDVLTSASSYRRTASREAALDVIRGEAGKQFDRDLVPVLEEIIRS